tara:strand:- start:353 stop:727 length:375 start_codon:yes stop_codon:yes gene_type:complete
MGTLTVSLNTEPLNESISVGDTVYYATLGSAVDGFISDNGSGLVKIGPVVSLGEATSGKKTIGITVSSNPNIGLVNDKLLLFSKNNQVNTDGLKGYYAEVKMKNTSTTEAELYAVSSEIALSSK